MPTPEERVRAEVNEALHAQGWGTNVMHGNQFQRGVPDCYAMHPILGTRWIDYKVEGRYSYTSAQRNVWCDWYYNFGVQIYILTSGEQLERLNGRGNFLDYWKPIWGCPEEYKTPLDPSILAEVLNGDWLEIDNPINGYWVSREQRAVISQRSGRMILPDNEVIRLPTETETVEHSIQDLIDATYT